MPPRLHISSMSQRTADECCRRAEIQGKHGHSCLREALQLSTRDTCDACLIFMDTFCRTLGFLSHCVYPIAVYRCVGMRPWDDGERIPSEEKEHCAIHCMIGKDTGLGQLPRDIESAKKPGLPDT